MKFEVKAYDALPCALAVFTINGKDADLQDFGEIHTEYGGEPYTCDIIGFEPLLPTDKVIKKYKLTLQDYSDICDALADAIKTGYCGWCI